MKANIYQVMCPFCDEEFQFTVPEDVPKAVRCPNCEQKIPFGDLELCYILPI